ncbi:F-box/WD repeat-containing protein 8-like isoform X2 [Babylonia areolata]|uniref:F-box/WD repeat-containing protein 8-like isoform X2 n=1 Tax=Babylonia areolata TaxID=304850 RepID=UPI003FD23C46
MANVELSEFRKNWLKELKQQNNRTTQRPSASDHSGPSSSAQAESTSDHRDSDFKPGGVTSEATDYTPLQGSVHKDEAGNCREQKESQRPPLPENEDCQQRALVDYNNAFDCHSEASATYYPFRILTTLLNRATSEEGPKHRRKTSGERQVEENSFTVPPKREYFSSKSHDDGKDASPKKAKKEDQKNDRDDESKDYLDLFIADLVSKSWRSLAEDELLWCRICHTLGFEKDTLTVEYSDWKSRVRQYTIIKRNLELNWKGRTGKLHNLHYAKGGVLCAVHSCNSTIVAGYSNCQTKLWEVMSGETCIFQPSSTALIIDESEEEGTISNEILHVATCSTVTAASYTHGFVDVWSNEQGTEPLYTFPCEGRGSLRQPSSLQLWENPQSVYLSVSSGHHVQVHSVRSGEGAVMDTWVFDSVVKKTKWLQDTREATTTTTSTLTPTLTIATNDTVSVVALQERDGGHGRHQMVELHNIVDAPVTCMDARLHPEQVVVGFTLNTGPAQYFRVDVYDIMTRGVTASLAGHTACVLCVNMAESPPHQLVTGSRDRKVRVFDTRAAQSALMTLMGHSAPVTTVQMDEWKVVSGDEAGFVCVWDQRMASKLWEMNNRHPVRYCHFEERQLVIGHVPYVKQHSNEFDFDTGLHQRHRGSLHVYDFLADQMRQGVPEICLSTYDEPQGYNYNITLAMPYDQV